MHDLQLVGFTTDRRGLIFRTSAGARVESYVVPITDELVHLVGQLAEATPDDDPADIEVAADEPVVAVAEPRAESQLSVRDIQSRLRAGEDVARVAVEAGVDEDWIERFAPPVRAEQRRIVERALDCHLERSRGGPSSMPLRRAVGRAMADKGIAFTVAAFEAAWSARLVGHDRWTVEFSYYHRGRDRTVSWDFDADAETLTTGDRTASQLGYVGADGEADDTTGMAVDGIIGDPEATTQIGAAQAAGGRSTRKRSAKKASPAKKRATKRKAAPAKKRATRKKAAPAKKRATRKKAAPAKKRATKRKAAPAKKRATRKKAAPVKKRATKRKAAPAKKRATKKKAAPAKKRATEKKGAPAKKRAAEKKAAPAKKRAAAQQVIREPAASPKVPPAEQVPGPSASGPAGEARSRGAAPAETAPAPPPTESAPRPTTDADRTGPAPRLTRDELDRLVPAVPGPASTNGAKEREDAAALSPEEELERLRARRVARQLAEDRTHAPAEDDRTAARRARAAERSAHTVQFRSGSAAPVRIAGATSGRPRPDAPETGTRRPTDAAADADTTGAPPPADANGAARPRSRRRRQLRAR